MKTITIPLHEFEDLLKIVGKLDYDINESGYDSADFSANFDLDWFYSVKNDANRLLDQRKSEL